MQNIENILWSLVPLVLIILFSWLFSFLGSKMKKPEENSEASAGKNLGDRILEMMKEGAEEVPPQQAAGGPAQPVAKSPFSMGSNVRLPQQSGGPPVTAKPINPKWWGA